MSFWEDRYSNEGHIWGDEPSPTVADAITHFQAAGSASVLVAGSGYGRNLGPFLGAGFEVSGLESSATAVRLARRFQPEATFIHASALDKQFDAPFDAVYAFNLLHLFRTRDRVSLVRQIETWLEPGGLAYVAVFSDEDYTRGRGEEVEPNTFESRPGRPAHYFTDEDLRWHFSAFDVIATGRIDEPEDHPPDGPHKHRLRYVVARKRPSLQ